MEAKGIEMNLHFKDGQKTDFAFYNRNKFRREIPDEKDIKTIQIRYLDNNNENCLGFRFLDRDGAVIAESNQVYFNNDGENFRTLTFELREGERIVGARLRQEGHDAWLRDLQFIVGSLV